MTWSALMRPGLAQLSTVVLAMFLLAGNASALVETEGAVAGTWTPDQNPYIVTDDIIINEDAYLEIAPGVEIFLYSDVEILVRGQLSILGDSKNAVKLTSMRDSEHWRGIRLINTVGPNLIQHANFEKSIEGIRVEGSELELTSVGIHAVRRGLSLFNQAKVTLRSASLLIEGIDPDARLVDATNSTLTVTNSWFELNNVGEDRNHAISAIRLYEVSGSISSSTILVESVPTAYAFNILYGSDFELHRNTIRIHANGNPMGLRPSAIRVVSSVVQITHVTIDIDSRGWPSSVIFGADRAQVSVLNSILSNTSGLSIQDNRPVDVDFFTDPAYVTVAYCCLHNMSSFVPAVGAHFERETLVLSDPMWENPDQLDYQLTIDSPCINAGVDFEGSDPDGTTPDIGRYSYYLTTSVPGTEPLLPEVFHLTHAYPNPFNSSTRFNVELQQATHLRVDVYDLLGRHVQRIADGSYSGGRHVFHWNAHSFGGATASGVYLLHIEGEGKVATQRVVLVR